MTDFYVTLPSNVPNSAFNNTTSRYVTRLPEVLRLRRDEWSVALTDLVYPHSFVNVGKPLHYWIHFKRPQPPIRVSFPAAHYLDLEHIINTLNKKPQIRMRRAAVDAVLGKENDEYLDYLAKEEAADAEKGARLLEGSVLEPTDEAKSLAGLITTGAVLANTIIDAEKKKEEERRREEKKRKDEANALAGLITTGAVVANTIIDAEKKKEERRRKEKKDEAKALAGIVATGVAIGNSVIADKKKEEKAAKKRKDEANALAGIVAAGVAIGNSVIGEKRLEEQRREEQRLKQQRLEEQRREEQRLEEQRREEQRLKQQRLEEEKLEEQKRLEEEEEYLKFLEQEHLNSNENFVNYAELAAAVMKKPIHPTDYRDLLVEFEKARSLVAVDEPNFDTSTLLYFEDSNGQLKINFNKPDEILFVEFEKACSYFLGFEDTIVRGTMVAPHKTDMFGDVSVIYLYSDLVDPIIVGNRKSNLLSVVPCTGQYGHIVYYTVPSPRYVPLFNSNIDSIRIELLTGAGDPIPFSWGTTVAVLHFKKIK
ncbi:hypothetical protein CAEBREN_32377 [Caenorhabditis brenneri]|uniref:Uncharacterized protein n=1 Tax=Caenorhabditis brenneri TaxID=135651 RepID=G0NJ64_CAEBE|nr:hypothetical protein CAEBREN_32377 [Caenorhabditis brenneri]